MSHTKPPERVLMISKDPTLLRNRTGFGDTLSRHIYYAQQLQAQSPGSEIRILTYAPSGTEHKTLNPMPGLKIYGTASTHRARFIFDAFKQLKQIFADGWVPTLVTTQEPWEDGQLGLWVARRYQARFIPQLHFDLTSQDWLQENPLNRIKRLIAQYTLHRADAVRAVSQVQKQKLVEQLNLNPDKVHVIPVGVSFQPSQRTKNDCQQTIIRNSRGKKVILFVGRICAQKNLALWVSVAQQVHQLQPDTHFVIAGDGAMRHEVQQQVNAAELDTAFTFLGNVAYAELPTVFGAADVFLLTSDYEGFGRVVVEAQLAGLPVVATSCTGPEDIVVDQETGYLCALGDRSGLAAAVLQLLQDDKKCQTFGQQGRQRVESMFGKAHLTELLIKMWTA